jgi:hypothetical protein
MVFIMLVLGMEKLTQKINKNRLSNKEVKLQTWNSTWRGTEGGGCSLSSASPLTKFRGCVLCTPSKDDQSIQNITYFTHFLTFKKYLDLNPDSCLAVAEYN